MPDTNKHITEYLEYYLDLNNAPEYAVMLCGEWGSGKTWFIKEFVSQHNKYKYLRVSLYGITSPREIEDAFYEQMHPILSSKVTKLTAKVLGGILKGAFKIDLNGDGKDDITVNSTIPSINLKEFNKLNENRVLIFDDLERCSISVTDLLGYINQFVENYGMKVILVANEKQIMSQNDLQSGATSFSYIQIKEKLVGKSFNIYSDLDAALKTFIEVTRTSDIIRTLNENMELLKEIYRNGGYNNLRHLKQSIMDFDRFCEFLPDDLEEKEGLVPHILELFFALSIEIKKGDLLVNNIPQLFLLDFEGNINNKPTIAQKIKKKYNVFNFYYHPIHFNFFVAYFNNGTMNCEELKRNILSSSYFHDENTPAWMKLLMFENLEDDVFVAIRDAVWDDLVTYKFDDKYVLMHVISILKFLSKKGLFDKEWNQIKSLGLQNFDELRSRGKLVMQKHEQFPGNHYAGYEYTDLSDSDFVDFISSVTKVVNDAQINDVSDKAEELLNCLASDPVKFITQLTLSNSRDNIYYDVAILTHINPERFVSVYTNLRNTQKADIITSLIRRYRHPEFIENLKPEYSWWQDVVKLINKLVVERKGEVSGFVFEKVEKTIQGFLKALEQ